jgi:hypothetical protein
MTLSSACFDESVNVCDVFSTIESWETTVTVTTPTNVYELFAGRHSNLGSNTFRLYYDPESEKTGLGGVIILDTDYNSDAEKVLFAQSSDEEQHITDVVAENIVTESEYERVTDIDVKHHNRTQELDAVLPLIRDAITDETWVRFDVDSKDIDLSDRKFLASGDNKEALGFDIETWVPVYPDAGWDAWKDAGIAIERFFSEEYDGVDVALSSDSITDARVVHELARYPHTAETVIDTVGMHLAEKNENPEVFRSLLIDYAKKNVCFDGVETPITAGVVTTEKSSE